MTNTEVGAIVLGLACGIAFIVVIAVMLDSFGSYSSTTPSHFLRIASKLYETRKILDLVAIIIMNETKRLCRKSWNIWTG